MKRLFVRDLYDVKDGQKVCLYGWISNKQIHKNIIFLILEDSTGKVSLLAEKSKIGEEMFNAIAKVTPESAIYVEGILKKDPKIEIQITNFEIISQADIRKLPRARVNIDVQEFFKMDYIRDFPYIMIRNEIFRAILKVRHIIVGAIHRFFRDRGFVEVHAPTITQLVHHDEESAFSLDYFGHKVFLTQCAGFYLEAAADAFERVYSIQPTFRARESRTRRHLSEFWDVKAVMAFSGLDDMVKLAEELVDYVVERVFNEASEELNLLRPNGVDRDEYKPPYSRITYEEVVEILKKNGKNINFGQRIGLDEEKELTKYFKKPYWVLYLPEETEAFSYKLHPQNPKLCMTADLMAPYPYGEIVGVNEKIYKYDELVRRMSERNIDAEKYSWYLQLMRYGHAPCVLMGMGLERLLSWILGLPHIRYTSPFPRLPSRKPWP